MIKTKFDCDTRDGVAVVDREWSGSLDGQLDKAMEQIPLDVGIVDSAFALIPVCVRFAASTAFRVGLYA